MTIDSTTMKNLIYNPTLIQKLILMDFDKNESVQISTATNPFVFLLEAATTVSSAQAMATRNIIRRKFPALAQTQEDLFAHLNSEQIMNIYSTPSRTNLIIQVDVFGIKNDGYTPKGGNYKEITLPIGTTITALNTTFTLLNSIIVRIYNDTETIHVESIPNDNALAINDVSLLKSTLGHSQINSPVIAFEVPVKQITKKTINKPVTKSLGCEIKVSLTDRYCYSEVYYTSKNNGDKPVKINQVFLEDYIDPTNPTAFVTITDTYANFKIPDVYIKNGSVTGTVTVVVYETKGEQYLPLQNYKTSEYSYSIAKGETASERAASNIKLVISANSILTGGKTGMTMEELKKSIIENTTGPIDVPVTQFQINKLGEDNNYSIKQIEDTLMTRVYTAFKPMDSFSSTVIKAMPDIFNNTVEITVAEYKTLYPHLVKDDRFLIKAGTVFREYNGKADFVSLKELEEIKNMDILKQIEHFNEFKYYYTPFNYIITTEDGATSSKVYYMENPSITNLRIMKKNLNLIGINAYVSKYSIQRVSNGFQIYISISGDTGFNKISKDNVKVQLSLPIDGEDYVHYVGSYDTTLDSHSFIIETNDFIDGDDKLQILNGTTTISTKMTALLSKAYIRCYITDNNYKDQFNYLVDTIIDQSKSISVLFEDTIDITFGTHIEHLWNRLHNTYSNRKYKVYEEDEELIYTEDQYEQDHDGNILFTISADGGRLERVLLHRKGDVVQNEQGETIYKHRKGDVVLDQYGEPVIDTESGLNRFLDILMLEYDFKIASSDPQVNFNLLILQYFENVLINELPNLNNRLLEQTTIQYRPNRSITPIKVKYNNITTTIPYRVSPIVTLYVDYTTDISLSELEAYKTKIGKMINEELNTDTINLLKLNEKIKSNLDLNIIACDIDGIIPDNAKVMTILDSNNTITLDKTLTYTDYNETIVVYNLTLKIVTT